MILAALLLALVQPSASATPAPAERPLPGTTLVLPSEPAGERWLSELLGEELPVLLARLGVPVVERHDRLRAYEALEIPATALTRATSIRIAEALGAGRVVIPAHEVKGEELVLSARILDIDRASLSGPVRVSGSLEGLERALRALAFDVALAGPVAPALGREAFLAEPPRASLAGLKAYGEALTASDPRQRQAALQRAVATAPGLDEARITLARALLQTREFGSAHLVLSKVPPSSPQQRTARFLQGVALLEMARHADAAATFAPLVSANPGAAALNNYGIALLRSAEGGGRQAKASLVFKQAVDREPASADLAHNLGLALLLEGDAEAAAFWLRAAARRDPTDDLLRVPLSWALRAAGRREEADREWRAVAAFSPEYIGLKNPDLSRRLERVQHSERLMVLEREVRSDAEVASSLVSRGERLLEAGNAAGAVRELTRAAYLDPHNARVHLILGRAHRAQGDSEKALNELRMSVWADDTAAVRLELANLLLQLGRTAEAAQEAQKVLATDPGNAAAQAIVERR